MEMKVSVRNIRKKVMDFINEIGYQPNTIAQSLSKGRMNIVALILGDIRNRFMQI